MKNIDNRRKEIFDILVENKTYPYINKKGKLYFRKKIKFLNDEKIEEIKNLFEIKDKESCDKFREEIKKEVLKNKEYVSIKNWVKEASNILGIDPLYAANEGKVIIIASKNEGEDILKFIKQNRLGVDSKIIGELKNDGKRVHLKTEIGTRRIVDTLKRDILPRIC